MSKLVTYCNNCTDFKGNRQLPSEYHGLVVKSLRGVSLCPRCKSPEVYFEDLNYTKALKEGFNPFDKPKTKRRV